MFFDTKVFNITYTTMYEEIYLKSFFFYKNDDLCNISAMSITLFLGGGKSYFFC